MRQLPKMLLLLFLSTSVAIQAADDPIVIKYEAQQAVRELETEINSIRTYPAEKRLRAELKLGDQMKRLERKYRGTKANNRILYLLADWQVTYELDQALKTMEQLKDSPYSAHKGTLDLIRVRYYLKTGDTNRARSIVNEVTERIPELSPVSDLVSLYEKRGEDAPHIEGNNLGGGSKNPLLDSSEPFLLYYFIELTDDWQLLKFEEYCFDNKYISSLSTWNELSEGSNWELLWANPSPKGDAEAWKATWGVRNIPNSVLVGVDRKILDVNPRLEDLQILAGEKPTGASSSSSGSNKGPRKGPRWR